MEYYETKHRMQHSNIGDHSQDDHLRNVVDWLEQVLVSDFLNESDEDIDSIVARCGSSRDTKSILSSCYSLDLTTETISYIRTHCFDTKHCLVVFDGCLTDTLLFGFNDEK